MPTIKVTNNGPYLVDGVDLVDAEGQPIDAEGTYALCRCGQSANKPFCDGTHSKVGFEG